MIRGSAVLFGATVVAADDVPTSAAANAAPIECDERRSAEDAEVRAMQDLGAVSFSACSSSFPSRCVLSGCVACIPLRLGANRRWKTLTQRLRRPHGALAWRSWRRQPPVYSPAAHGRPQAKNVQIPARQAPCAARDLHRPRPGLPELQAAEAPASRLPELQDVQGPGRRAAPHLVGSARYSAHDSEWPSTRWAAIVLPPRSSRGPPPLPRPRSSPCCTGLPASTRAACRSSRRTTSIGMDDHPVESVRAKPDSSLVRGGAGRRRR